MSFLGWLFINYSQQYLLISDYQLRKMAANRSFFDGLVEELLKSKQTNYSQDCISYYLDEKSFVIEDLTKLYNNRQQKMKGTLIRHRNIEKGRDKQKELNTKCIVYLHGLGSSRLEALNIAQHLPKNYCICIFDMSGSGKSQGQFITYGVKQHEDIEPVITYLHRQKYIQEFFIWGRSMGAVATLYYATQNYQLTSTKQRRNIFSTGTSLRNSMINSKSSNIFESESLVKGIVLDSPFHNFRDIAKQIATKKMSIPNFVLDIALNYVEQSFTRILRESIGEKYNPFEIIFNKQIKLRIPIIFVYSQKDEIIPAYQSQLIIKNIKSKFEKILINQCTHNQARPQSIINEIFTKLDKFNRMQTYQDKKMNQSISRDMTISYSCQKKRGIFVYTPSRQKDSKNTIDDINNNKRNSLSLLRDTIQIGAIQTQIQSQKSPRSRTSLVRRNPVSLKYSRKSKDHFQKKLQTIETDNFLSSLNTIDTETNKLISQKLNDVKDTQSCISKVARSKRINMDKVKQLRLTHHKYLE